MPVLMLVNAHNATPRPLQNRRNVMMPPFERRLMPLDRLYCHIVGSIPNPSSQS